MLKKIVLLLSLFFLSSCDVAEIDQDFDFESPVESPVESPSIEETIDNSNFGVVYDFELGILSDFDLADDTFSHISKDLIILRNEDAFAKLTFKHILIIHDDSSDFRLIDNRDSNSEEGVLYYSLDLETKVFTLNVGSESNILEYVSLIPQNIFQLNESITLSLPEKDYIESENGALRLFMSPILSEDASVGVLTGALPAGSTLPFFLTIPHTTYNDKNDLFRGDHNIYVILQEHDFDMGVSANTYGIDLKKGEVASKQIAEDLRVIFVRPSSTERKEIFQLREEIFQIDGQDSFQEFARLVDLLIESFREEVQATDSNNQNQNADEKKSSNLDIEYTDLSLIKRPADYCRLEQRSREGHHDVLGFPIEYIIPNKGEINVAVVPVDFEDYPGDPALISKLESDLPLMTDWSKFYSGGQMIYRVHTTNEWIRAPKKAEYYRSRDGVISEGYQGKDTRILPLLQSQEESVTQLIYASDSLIDWSIIDVAIFIFSAESIEQQTHLYLHRGNFELPTKGNLRFSVYGENFDELLQALPNLTYWDWSVHEILHWQGLVGHGPLNHSDYSIMTNQYSSTAGLHAWEAFLLDWWSEDDFMCIDPNDIEEPLIVRLDSIDQLGAANGQKSIMLPMNKDEILIIEYRTKGEWSSLETMLEGIVIYYVDVNGDYVRCDSCNQIEIEQQNFWRILRNQEIMPCDKGFVPHCGYPSIVQKPGYELTYLNLRFKILANDTIEISKISS